MPDHEKIRIFSWSSGGGEAAAREGGCRRAGIRRERWAAPAAEGVPRVQNLQDHVGEGQHPAQFRPKGPPARGERGEGVYCCGRPYLSPRVV